MRNILFLFLFLPVATFAQVDGLAFAKTMAEWPRDSLTENFKRSGTLLDSAIAIGKQNRANSLLGDLYDQKAVVLTAQGDDAAAVEANLKSIVHRRTAGEMSKVARSYGALAYQVRHTRPENSRDYFSKAIKIGEEVADEKELHIIYDNYGTFLNEQNQMDSSFIYHRKSLKIKKRLQDSVGLPYTYGHLAMGYLKQGDYQRALQYVDSSQAIRTKLNQRNGIAVGYVYYGDVYYGMGSFPKAVENYKRSYELSSEIGNDHLTKYALQHLYLSYDSLGDYEQAYQYMREYQQLQERFTDERNQRRFAELEVKFNTQEKENEILLQKVQLAESRLQARRQWYWIIGLIAIAVVIAVLGYLLYERQRARTRQQAQEYELRSARKEVEAQKRLKEQRHKISRDLHDNIGSQLTYIITSINRLKQQIGDKPDAQSQLDELGQFTTGTIKELRDTIWAMNQESIELSSLHSRIAGTIGNFNQLTESNTQIKSDFTTEEGIVLNSVAGMNIYRVIQEALNNAIKYSDAKYIKVITAVEDGHLKIHINDNGKGFEPEGIREGNGLKNMEFRASEINGDFKLSSLPGTGTNITLTVPLKHIVEQQD